MLRICFIVTGTQKKIELENKAKNNQSDISFDILNDIFKTNNNYYFTTNYEECFQRLKHNLSDFTNAIVPHYKDIDGSNVPIEMFSSKIQLVSGYKFNVTKIKPQECASVIANVNLIDSSVHLATLCFILFSILVVFTSILFQLKYLNQRKRKTSFCSILFVKRVVNNLMKELSFIYYGSSTKFKCISLLFAILIFYLTKSFMCIYKTSQLIVYEPYVIKNYQMLLNDRKSLPIFRETLSKTSTLFKTAHEESLRGKIWKKLTNSHVDLNEYVYPGEKNIDIKFLTNLFKKMNEENSAFIGSTFQSQFILTYLCCISPENELWKFFMFTDESEDEQLLGHALSVYYQDKKSIIRRFRLAIESNISLQFYAHFFKYLEKKLNTVFKRSHQHQYKQNLLCSNYYKPNTKPNIHSIGIKFYQSFFCACLVVVIIAFFVNLFEQFARFNKRKRQIFPLQKLRVKVKT